MRYNRTNLGNPDPTFKVMKLALFVWGLGTILGITMVGYIGYLVVQALRKYIGG